MRPPLMSRSSPKKNRSPELPAEDSRPSVELAGMGVRLMCAVYDALLIIALNAVIGAILIGFATPDEASARHQATVLSGDFRRLVLFPVMVLTTWLFYGYFWRKQGQTLGMQTWRIRVIRPDGSLLGWADSFGRCAAAMILPAFCGLTAYVLYRSPGLFMISLLFGFAGNYLWAFLHGRGVAWHDMLSRTVVIRVPSETGPKKDSPD